MGRAHVDPAPAQQARRVDLGGHVGELEGDRLVLDDRHPEGLALHRVLHDCVEGRPGDPDGLDADDRARRLEGRQRAGLGTNASSGLVAPPTIFASSLSCPPSSWSSGTNTSCRRAPRVRGPDPELLDLLGLLKPSASLVTMNDAWPRWPRFGSTVATTMWTSAIPPLVIQIFSPLSSQPPSTFSGAGADLADVGAGTGLGHAYAPTLTSSGVPKIRGAHSAICSPVPDEARPASARPEPKIASPIPRSPRRPPR
jgi:hypothetical protein